MVQTERAPPEMEYREFVSFHCNGPNKSAAGKVKREHQPKNLREGRTSNPRLREREGNLAKLAIWMESQAENRLR